MRGEGQGVTETFDLVVIGGGPAGSTLAGLAKRYNPGKRVLVLEQAAFPRYHVGESLLIGVVPILKELGAFEKIDAAGFPKKLGSTYVWGRDRSAWTADFTQIPAEEVLGPDGGQERLVRYSWQVERARYDAILLEHAASLGAEVRHGWRALDVVEDAGRVAGVTVCDASGATREIRAQYVADCSGQSGFLSSRRRVRRYDPRLGNVAVHGYFRGARWKTRFVGHPDKTRIFLCTAEGGWFWYFPISRGIVSVGLVTTRRGLAARRTRDFREHFLQQARSCPEISGLLSEATLTGEVFGDGKEVHVERDWSYLNVASSGPGWLCAGDACVFVDPVLSSGVLLAHTSGHRAACALTTIWRGALPAERVWEDYNAHYRRASASFLACALFWYGNDRVARKWWGLTEQLVRARLPLPVRSRQAFVTVVAGVQDYYDRLYQAEFLVTERAHAADDFPLAARGAWAGAPAGHPAELREEDRFSFPWKWEAGYTLVPELETGVLRPLKTVKFLKHASDDPLVDVLNPVRIVAGFHLALLARLQKGAAWGEALDALPRGEGGALRRSAAKLVADLLLLGALRRRSLRRRRGLVRAS